MNHSSQTSDLTLPISLTFGYAVKPLPCSRKAVSTPTICPHQNIVHRFLEDRIGLSRQQTTLRSEHFCGRTTLRFYWRLHYRPSPYRPLAARKKRNPD
eukprot:scaffold4201_cov178-Amphora_coffeaeformis.AAC.3